MTATGHAVIGTVIAAKIGNPALAIPIALISHTIADLFPHWDTGTNARQKGRNRLFIDSALDVLASVFLSYLIIYFLFPATSIFYAFIVILAAQLYDWMIVPYYFFKMNIPPFNWIYKFQKMFDNSLDKPWGIIYQIAVLIFILTLAKII